MGTSVNQASPNTLSWASVAVLYDGDMFPVERIAEDVWRAATAQVEGNLADDLGTDFVGKCLLIAEQASDAGQALKDVRLAAMDARHSSLAVDIAQRAVVNSILRVNESRVDTFVSTLFAEASNYLVSRDITGHVGQSERTESVSSTRKLKEKICDSVVERVRRVPRPENVEASLSSWSSYVSAIVTKLRGGS